MLAVRTWIARLAASFAAMVVGALLNLLPFIQLTDEQVTSVVGWFTDGLTGLGWFVLMAMYGIFHKLLNRKINPNDVAKGD